MKTEVKTKPRPNIPSYVILFESIKHCSCIAGRNNLTGYSYINGSYNKMIGIIN